MEILKILQESAESLIPEDLDFFETELATGGHYNAAYQAQCRKLIKQLRKWMKGEIDSLDEEDSDSEKKAIVVIDEQENNNNDIAEEMVPKGIVMGLGAVVPKEAEQLMPKMSMVQQVQSDMIRLRGRTDYKSAFKKYAKDSQIIDADFLDKNFSVFSSWEMNAIVSVKQLGEEFLEKYFGSIDHEKIARYQLFSENFFMKHFSQMDAEIVLRRGKNEWCKKENRSKQLDVFLRLKGVKF